jgi:hypothetical protein
VTPGCQVGPAGTYLSDGGTSVSLHDSVEDCEICPAGTYLSDGGTSASLHDSVEDCDGVCPAGTTTADRSAPEDHDSVDDCDEVCPAGSYSDGVSPGCRVCPVGSTPLVDLSGCKTLLLCADDEYMRDETCEKCDNTLSFVLVGVSLVSFVAIIYFVDLRSQQQGTMIGIKSITAFYQSAQLTTLVSIPWPKIALWAPFTIP